MHKAKCIPFHSILLVGADIDVLCVAPRLIDREQFTNGFADELRQLDGVRDLRVRRVVLLSFSFFCSSFFLLCFFFVCVLVCVHSTHIHFYHSFGCRISVLNSTEWPLTPDPLYSQLPFPTVFAVHSGGLRARHQIQPERRRGAQLKLHYFSSYDCTQFLKSSSNAT